MEERVIITISRQFGSGGKNIGKTLAKRLNIPFYDQELVIEGAKEAGINPEIVKEIEETPTNSLLYSITAGTFMGTGHFSPIMDLPMTDKVFIAQSDTIKRFAEKGSCIVVGRCGNYILKDDPDLFSFFIHRPIKERINQVAKLYDINAKKAEELILKTDKKRKSYYNFYTDGNWGHIDNYDLTINSGKMGEDGCVDIIESFIHKTNLRKKTRGLSHK